MDTTTKIRNISILCHAERHNYCFAGCDCSCHFDLKFETKLTVLAYELWRISTAFALPEESIETREGRLLGVIRSAQNSVDFQDYTPEEVAEKMKLTLARDYWSLRETAEDFNLNAHTGIRIS